MSDHEWSLVGRWAAIVGTIAAGCSLLVGSIHLAIALTIVGALVGAAIGVAVVAHPWRRRRWPHRVGPLS